MDICVYCAEEITGRMISDIWGMAHRRCFNRAHPYQPKDTLSEVLSADHQSRVRQLILKYMPTALHEQIIEEYNRLEQDEWLRGVE